MFPPIPPLRCSLLAACLGAGILRQLTAGVDPAVSGVLCGKAINAEATLSWKSEEGFLYGVERSESLVSPSWKLIGEKMPGDGLPQFFTDWIPPVTRAFYRVSYEQDNFEPGALSPQWQLDATKDFPATADDTAVSRWWGTGLISDVQESAEKRPVLRAGAVHFDGGGDYLSFPMWENGVGSTWTLALLMKVRKGIGDYDWMVGGDLNASRVLEFQYAYDGLVSLVDAANWVAPVDDTALPPNDNWRIVILRYDGAQYKTQIDWFKSVKPGPARTTGRWGKFNLGCGFDPANSSKVSIRYAAYFPACITDEDTVSLWAWMEKKKLDEHPAVTLVYGGGQSNFLTSRLALQRELVSSFENTALAFSYPYGGTPLIAWMRDRDQGGGFEVCPYYDLSNAPAGSPASFQKINHSGSRVIEAWRARARTVAKNPKDLVACIFIQGESDIDDARFKWKPNGVGNYYSTYTDPYALSGTYGPRASAWNAAVRSATGHENMVFIHERLWFPVLDNFSSVQKEGYRRQRKTQLDSLANDARYLLVDTDEFPRSDNVHFTNPVIVPSAVPNTEAERFSRAAVRLMKASGDLAQLGADARMIAMRAVDSGATLDAAGYAACATLAAHPEFGRLRSLVVPGLSAGNAVDQERLRRCNLVLHLGDAGAAGFAGSTPAVCTATCKQGGDMTALGSAISSFLAGLGLPGPVDLQAVP